MSDEISINDINKILGFNNEEEPIIDQQTVDKLLDCACGSTGTPPEQLKQGESTVPKSLPVNPAFIGNYGWLCPRCGRGNSPYTMTCPCVPAEPIQWTCTDHPGAGR